jgi:hypothetical protein
MSNHKNHRQGHVDKRERAFSDLGHVDNSQVKRSQGRNNHGFDEDQPAGHQKIKNKKKLWK